MQEIWSKCLDKSSEIIDISPRQIDLRQHLGLPAGVRYRRCDVAESGALTLPPGAALVSLVGPDTFSYNPPDELRPVLRRLQPDNRALLLPAWPIEQLPYRQVLRPLTEEDCQVTRAIALPASSIREVQCALVVEAATSSGTAATSSGTAATSSGTAATSSATVATSSGSAATGAATDRADWLRLTNEHLLSDLIARELRHRATTLRKQSRAKVAECDARVDDAERQLAKAQQRINDLESSTAMQVGRVVVDGARRRPVRAVIGVPAKLARLWFTRRRAGRPRPRTSGQERTTGADPTPPQRVVSIALPETAHGRRNITITAPRSLRIPRQLAKRGLASHEPDAMACFLAAIEVAGPGAVLDIGANVGIYAAVGSAVSDREVVAFEPTPALGAVSRRIAADNALHYSVESLALGAEDGTATLFLSDRSDASNSLSPGFRESSEQVTVPLEKLDSYVGRTGVSPAVMKIDTETTEPEVLKGAARTIAEYRPWILCEVLAGKVERRLTKAIAPFGYHWYQITEQVPYPETGQIAGSSGSRMWLFAPARPPDGFWAAVRTQLAALTTVEPGGSRPG